jgi:hypothetical protein
VVQLVLAQERTYDELAQLLGISADAVRARAHAGLERLAPADSLDPEDRARIADYLLGQQGVSAREATRELLADDPEAHSWATAVATELAPVARSPLPDVPAVTAATPVPGLAQDDHASPWDDEDAGDRDDDDDRDLSAAEPADRPVRARPRPRAGAPATESRARETRGDRKRSSLLGGALLLGGVAIVVAAMIVYLINRDGGSTKSTSTSTSAAASPTPSATPQVAGQIPLSAVGGGKQKGAMTIFVSQNGQVAFTIEATDVPASKQGEAYALWLTGGDKPHRLGFAPTVGADGQLGTSGPRDSDATNFVTWFSKAKAIVVTRETSQDSTKPGTAILRGRIPSASASATATPSATP